MKSKTAATIFALGVGLLWTSSASAQEPLPPIGAEQEREVRPNRPLLLAGATTIAASYIPAVAVAATSERKGDDYLYIPIAGPWMDLATRGGCAPNTCETEAVYKTGLVAAGVAHLVGTGLVVSSFLVPENRLEPGRRAKPMVVPTQMGRAGAGLSVVGRF